MTREPTDAAPGVAPGAAPDGRRGLVAALVALALVALVALTVTAARTLSADDPAAAPATARAVVDTQRTWAADGARLDRAALVHTVRQARPDLSAAATTLEVTAGRVGDESLPTALVAAVDDLAALLASATARPAQIRAAEVVAASGAVRTARLAVEDAHARWLVDEAARLADEAAAAAEQAAAGPAAVPGPTPGADGRPRDAAGNVLWVTSVPTTDGDGTNGNLPMSAMCRIPWGTDQLGYAQYLRCDAADALTRLNTAFRERFGEPIAMDLTYRSYADQVAMKAAFGALAARPGTSSHGTGTALDVQEWPDVYGFGTARYEWLVANGPTFGWSAPARVRADGAYPEYWHFEFGAS